MRSLWFCWFFLSLMATSVNQGTFAQSDAERGPAHEGSLFWIFLMTGKNTQRTEPAELEKMQAAHLANFGRLYKEGKLLAAGPMADPQKQMRGIVVGTAPDLKSLSELFEPDPYLKQGYLSLDAIPMEIAVGAFQRDIVSESLAEFRLVILEKSKVDGAEIDANTSRENLEYSVSIHDAERLCFAGWLREDKLRRGILIFRKLDDAQLKSLVEEFPAVKSGLWKGTTIPLYMSEGIVK